MFCQNSTQWYQIDHINGQDSKTNPTIQTGYSCSLFIFQELMELRSVEDPAPQEDIATLVSTVY